MPIAIYSPVHLSNLVRVIVVKVWVIQQSVFPLFIFPDVCENAAIQNFLNDIGKVFFPKFILQYCTNKLLLRTDYNNINLWSPIRRRTYCTITNSKCRKNEM